MDWRTVKLIEDGAGQLRLRIETRDGERMFRFVLERYFGPAPDDEGQWPDGFWAEDSISGYYQTMIAAERDARASIGWLRDQAVS